ncbi:MAG: GHKL domain-containing protein [Bacteroidales bacterium]|nr:GHKL domain-containing protein [Bacteroidales bacterium]
MGSRSFHIKLFALLVLLVISAAVLGWALSSSRMHLAILLGIVILVGAVFIFQQLTRSNREVLFFFRALENDDTSINYSSSHRNKFIDELHQHLNKVNGNFQELKLSNELREKYFSQILEHLSSGLIVISKTGHINHINNEALRLLNLPKLTHIRVLSQLYPGFYGRIRDMKSLDHSEIKLQDGETGIKRVLGLQVVEINLKGEDVRVLTLHDLSAGMERKEVDDWIRLIRIMSHEIMNSLAPITSISTTLREVWTEHESNGVGNKTSEATIQQTLKGLDAIAEQSAGLTTFFESYRVLSRIPDPVIKEFAVCGIFEKLETLVDHYKTDSSLGISFECDDQELKIQADEQMITQVMLNLIKNAVQAVEMLEKAEIIVSALPQENRVVLKVTDNGEGIPPEISDEIFMPFFTTRRKGTGVGLSYSRQVMAMNNGRIEFDSQPGRTQFRLLF